ncbi:hypothetical protein HFP57_12195 [Parasphingopyxis algicola]|uniref:hypothetical protein n=1 Tax=Parasphingopyxis algicola TaxID=2026624 RepID=UPI0015A42A3A|nr:hypothetical protein [Parasphingopyxis algicola]QLC25702.1 hypothetical protein HFP57_12195 [Parasphingopyxis algicola]
MNWLTLIGSLAAVFALAAAAWFLGMGKTPRIGDEAEAEQLARDAHSGFVPAGAAVSRDGKAALVAGAAGDFVLLREHGANIVARVLREAPRAAHENAILVIATGERLFGDLRLDLGEAAAAHWSENLGKRQSEAAHE